MRQNFFQRFFFNFGIIFLISQKITVSGFFFKKIHEIKNDPKLNSGSVLKNQKIFLGNFLQKFRTKRNSDEFSNLNLNGKLL